MSDLYQYGGDNLPNQPNQPGVPGGPGGGDLYNYNGDNLPQPGAPGYQQGFNPFQQQIYANPQIGAWRPQQYWAGANNRGGDTFVTAYPGSEVNIYQGDVNAQGGMNYDYRYPGGQNYNYAPYYPRQYYQPNYYQSGQCGCYCGQGGWAQPYYQMNQPYYAGGQYYNNNSVYGGPGGFYANNQNYGWSNPGYSSYPGTPPFVNPGYGGNIGYQGYPTAGQSAMNTIGSIFGMALQGFDAYAGYDVARRYARNAWSNSYYPYQALSYGQMQMPHGNYQHGWQRGMY